MRVDCNLVGRVVTFQLPRPKNNVMVQLTLCEVEVYGFNISGSTLIAFLHSYLIKFCLDMLKDLKVCLENQLFIILYNND